MFDSAAAQAAWDRLEAWAEGGTGGGRRVSFEILGHASKGRATCVLTLSEWARDVAHPRPNTVTCNRFTFHDEAFADAVNYCLTRWALEDFDNLMADE